MSTATNDDWLNAAWMLTHSGGQFRPLAPRAEDIDIVDIAHSLSMQCRYNGHTRRFYSVAEHCVLISGALAEDDALWGLLHDAAEAYVGDMVRPLKIDMPAFRRAEDEILKVIAERFSLNSFAIPDAVHDADNRILLTERAALLNLGGHRWHESIESLQPLAVAVTGWPPPYAKQRFLTRFAELGGVQ